MFCEKDMKMIRNGEICRKIIDIVTIYINVEKCIKKN